MALFLTFINELHTLLQENGINPFNWEIRSISVCDSTNDFVLRMFKLNSPMTVVLSKVQEKGRGRGTNTWESPNGGLWLSIGINLPIPIMELSTPIVNTVSEVLSSYVDCTIKPPNDIFVSDKKLSGVLVETKMSGDQMTEIIIGIGINVENDIPESIAEIATTLKNHISPPTVPHLAAKVATAIILKLQVLFTDSSIKFS